MPTTAGNAHDVRRSASNVNATSANGVYAYGSSSSFPANTYQATDYWVDVLYAPGLVAGVPGAPQNVSGSPASSQAQAHRIHARKRPPTMRSARRYAR